jgi:hypothetical protein
VDPQAIAELNIAGLEREAGQAGEPLISGAQDLHHDLRGAGLRARS